MCNNRLILYVDDNDAAREIAKMTLEDNYNVVALSNGEEAYRYLKSRAVKPCLIFTDFHMPIMDGAELLRWVRSEPELSPIPVVGVAGVTSMSMPGADEYLTKPFTLERLEAMASKWVKRHNNRGPSSRIPRITPPKINEATRHWSIKTSANETPVEFDSKHLSHQGNERAATIAHDALWYHKGDVKAARKYVTKNLKSAGRGGDAGHLKQAHSLLTKAERHVRSLKGQLRRDKFEAIADAIVSIVQGDSVAGATFTLLEPTAKGE